MTIQKQILDIVLMLKKIEGQIETVLNAEIVRQFKMANNLLQAVRSRIEEKSEIDKILQTTQLENDAMKRRLKDKGINVDDLSPHAIQFLNLCNDDSLSNIRDIVAEIDKEDSFHV